MIPPTGIHCGITARSHFIHRWMKMNKNLPRCLFLSMYSRSQPVLGELKGKAQAGPIVPTVDEWQQPYYVYSHTVNKKSEGTLEGNSKDTSTESRSPELFCCSCALFSWLLCLCCAPSGNWLPIDAVLSPCRPVVAHRVAAGRAGQEARAKSPGGDQTTKTSIKGGKMECR